MSRQSSGQLEEQRNCRERAIQSVQCMIRTLRSSLERKWRVREAVHSIWQWIAARGFLLTFDVGRDEKTPHGRLNGESRGRGNGQEVRSENSHACERTKASAPRQRGNEDSQEEARKITVGNRGGVLPAKSMYVICWCTSIMGSCQAPHRQSLQTHCSRQKRKKCTVIRSEPLSSGAHGQLTPAPVNALALRPVSGVLSWLVHANHPPCVASRN